MRILFAGTPDFAATALHAIVDAGHEVVAVLTQPDRPAQRGLKTLPGAVKTLALDLGLPVIQPASLNSEQVLTSLAKYRADVMVVAAYGTILPRRALELGTLGSVNIHASLLPRWRGAAPIVRALLAGDRETGISIMKMDEGLDTGPVLMQRTVAIEDGDTAATLHDKLAMLGAEMIVEALPRHAQADLPPSPQPEVGVSYAHKVEKLEAVIVWEKTGDEVSRQIRAFNPSPGAYSRLAGRSLKLWMATARDEITGPAGEIMAVTPEAILVACGKGGIALTEMQKPGGRRRGAVEFARGHRITPGLRFG